MTDDTAPVSMLLVGLLVALVLASVQWALVEIYVLNFSLAGPNVTAVLVLLLAGGWTVAALPWLSRKRHRLTAALLAAAVGLVVAAVAPVRGALVAAVAVQLLLVPVLVAVGQNRRTLVGGTTLGIGLFVTLRAWFDTAPPFATLEEKLLIVVVGLLALGCWRVLDRRDAVPVVERTVPLLGLAAFLLAEGSFLGLPAAMATWAGRSYPLVAAATVAGLLAGGVLLSRRGTPSAVETVGWAVLFLAGLAALLWGHLAGGASAFPTQVAAVCLLARGTSGPRRSPRREAGLVCGLQLVGVVLLFVHVSALNWAFVPAPLSTLVRGRHALFLFGVGALLPMAILARVVRTRVERVDVRPDRRSVLGLTASGVLTLAGIGAYEGTSPVRAADPPLVRAMTYNVHQFLAPDGSYNLHALGRVLADHDPHIVGLQESDSGRITSGSFDGVRWLADQLGYHYTFGTPTGAGSYGAALLSRWPIERERVVYLPVQDSPPRPALVADLDAPGGTLPVVVAHFQTGKPGDERVAEARRIVDLVGDERRAIVLTDCNTIPGQPPYRVLRNAFTDAWTAANGAASGDTYSASDPHMRIDYVWTGSAWAVERAEVTGSARASDHRAVLATLRPEE